MSIMAIVILLFFLVLAGQAVNIQFFRASALDKSPQNPRNSPSLTQFPRGEIVAVDGTVLAKSIPSTDPFHPWQRIYPLGSLTSGVVGFASPTYGTTKALEAQYNSVLTAHPLPPQSFVQVLAPAMGADSITLTLDPALQQVARTALGGQDGAAVVLDPSTGAVMALYSNPTYDPAPMASTNAAMAKAQWKKINQNNAHGFPPLGLVAIQQTFPPGSTFKVITTAAVVAGRPDLLTKSYHYGTFTALPNSNLLLHNSGGSPCGGIIAVMLPESCDPGFALVGLDVGAKLLASTAKSFGYGSVPPIDLLGAVASYFPPAASFSNNAPGLAYSAIGQENVRATALQGALEASAIADNGVIMTPHLLEQIIGPDGSIVERYKPLAWLHPLTSAQALQIVTMMQNVVRSGTAFGIFPSNLDVAAKTGTAQVGNAQNNTDDWMIAFAPATHPTVAVAVVMPFQPKSAFGATVAGPIVKCLIEGALAIQAGRPASGTATTCPR